MYKVYKEVYSSGCTSTSKQHISTIFEEMFLVTVLSTTGFWIDFLSSRRPCFPFILVLYNNQPAETWNLQETMWWYHCMRQLLWKCWRHYRRLLHWELNTRKCCSHELCPLKKTQEGKQATISHFNCCCWRTMWIMHNIFSVKMLFIIHIVCCMSLMYTSPMGSCFNTFLLLIKWPIMKHYRGLLYDTTT